MTTTVYFATNRAVNNPPEAPTSYTLNMIAPEKQMAYGSAFVDSSDLPGDNVGTIRSLQDFQAGDFSATAKADIESGGRNILVFIHGFANSFADAITRAAFNREWLTKSNVPGADTTVIAFSWPSRGHVIEPPFPSYAYHSDQRTAGKSGPHLARFFANLLPLLQNARNNGLRTFLLAHSMGNWALQAATEAWFSQGQGPADLFDEALLAAADEEYTSFERGPFGRLSAFNQLARRISIYHSTGDRVLDDLAETLNLKQRLGQRGPAGYPNASRFPASTYRVVDCSGYTDYLRTFQATHQYYRRSEGVRTDIASVMA
ncbi:MAG: alpha/beta fold hydrolase [Reyranella sp.]|uniref:alpha/beta fold hydrolase n=1 Tax=Reyranella sp. TaxID=1929291 RepID=UPI003D0C8DC7